MNKPNLMDADHVAERTAELTSVIEDMVSNSAFPCVGAKSALARKSLKVISAHSLDSNWDDVKLHSELLEWSYKYRESDGGLRSLAVVFEGPVDLTEDEFEEFMWERIQSLADKDAWRGQPYDQRVSPDPSDPHFSLSFGGEAFFVVGLHPNASRPARRCPHPTLVFNLHDQFTKLREEGRYARMREAILERDKKLAGTINPMLAKHGESSEARQYSGRMVGSDWKCPFSDPRAA